MIKLRFVQRFKQSGRRDFTELEREFVQLEQHEPTFPKARRFIPVTGREPSNTMIWEAEFNNMEEASRALEIIEGNAIHNKLFIKQSAYMLDAYTEIYEEFK